MPASQTYCPNRIQTLCQSEATYRGDPFSSVSVVRIYWVPSPPFSASPAARYAASAAPAGEIGSSARR